MDQVAAQKPSNAEVKAFAQQVVADEDINSTVTPFAQGGVALPSSADAKHQQEVAKLNGLSGAAFDKEYLAFTVAGHKEIYKRFKAEASSSKDVPFRDAAITSRNSINNHLAQAEALQKKL